MQFLETFDAPDVCDCYRRTASIRPQQALALANSNLALDLSRTLARKLSTASAAQLANASAATNGEFITTVFETILSRRPSEAERQAATEFLEEQLRVLKTAKSEELSLAPPAGVRPPASELPQRARELFVHALYNHNDFVTVR